jgi:hypothetical protein
MIEGIKLKIKGQKLTLSLEEVKELSSELNSLLNNSRPYYNPNPYWYGNSITLAGSTTTDNSSSNILNTKVAGEGDITCGYASVEIK